MTRHMAILLAGASVLGASEANASPSPAEPPPLALTDRQRLDLQALVQKQEFAAARRLAKTLGISRCLLDKWAKIHYGVAVCYEPSASITARDFRDVIDSLGSNIAPEHEAFVRKVLEDCAHRYEKGLRNGSEEGVEVSLHVHGKVYAIQQRQSKAWHREWRCSKATVSPDDIQAARQQHFASGAEERCDIAIVVGSSAAAARRQCSAVQPMFAMLSDRFGFPRPRSELLVHQFDLHGQVREYQAFVAAAGGLSCRNRQAEVTTLGFFDPSLKMIGVLSDGSAGTLRHELVHVVMAQDSHFEWAPRWFSEGLAALHEVVDDSSLEGEQTNPWRTELLRQQRVRDEPEALVHHLQSMSGLWWPSTSLTRDLMAEALFDSAARQFFWHLQAHGNIVAFVDEARCLGPAMDADWARLLERYAAAEPAANMPPTCYADVLKEIEVQMPRLIDESSDGASSASTPSPSLPDGDLQPPPHAGRCGISGEWRWLEAFIVIPLLFRRRPRFRAHR